MISLEKNPQMSSCQKAVTKGAAVMLITILKNKIYFAEGRG